MTLYPKINDTSILLHNDCKRMLRRNSRKVIINEVIEKLNNGDKKESLFLDANINNTNNSKKNILELVLNILGCNKS